MKQSITQSQFIHEFDEYNRGDNFSYEGRAALYDWFKQLADDRGEELELDVIALCCEFSEYADLEEIQENYSDIRSLEDLYDSTIVIEFSGGIIIQDF